MLHNFHLRREEYSSNIQRAAGHVFLFFSLSGHLKQQHLGFPSFCLYFFTPAVNDAEYSWTIYINVCYLFLVLKLHMFSEYPEVKAF